MENRSPVKYLYHLALLIQQRHAIDMVNVWGEHDLTLPQDAAAFVDDHTFQTACLIALEQANDPDLGIAFGQSITITHFGPLGAAMMSCACFEDAIKLILEYADVFVPFGVTLGQQKNGVSISAHIPEICDAYTEFHSLAFITGAVQSFKELLGFVPNGIKAELPCSALSTEQQALLPFSLKFNKAQAYLYLPKEVLALHLPRYDEVSKSQFLEICQRIKNNLAQEEALSEQITKLLDNYDRYPSIEQLSQTLNISDRTLRYRLKKESSNYREIVSQHRLRRANDLLQHSALSIDQIAEKTGYKDTPSFYRAYKKAFGCTPAAFRNDRCN